MATRCVTTPAPNMLRTRVLGSSRAPRTVSGSSGRMLSEDVCAARSGCPPLVVFAMVVVSDDADYAYCPRLNPIEASCKRSASAGRRLGLYPPKVLDAVDANFARFGRQRRTFYGRAEPVVYETRHSVPFIGI